MTLRCALLGHSIERAQHIEYDIEVNGTTPNYERHVTVVEWCTRDGCEYEQSSASASST